MVKVLEGELTSKELDEFFYSPIIVTCNNNVVNINQEINHSTTFVRDKQKSVSMRVGKARGDKKIA